MAIEENVEKSFHLKSSLNFDIMSFLISLKTVKMINLSQYRQW